MNNIIVRVSKLDDCTTIGVYNEKEKMYDYLDFNMIDNGRYWICTLCGADDEPAITNKTDKSIMHFKEVGLGDYMYNITIVKDEDAYEIAIIEL